MYLVDPRIITDPHDLAARCLRASSHSTYDSRLVAFFEWCHNLLVDPHHASLTCIADFLVSLFDKKKFLATIRGYRSAIGSIHRGFPDGSSVSTSIHLCRLLRAFFLENPPVRTLVPFCRLPVVVRALSRPPFEPLALASFYHLTLKTVFVWATSWYTSCSYH